MVGSGDDLRGLESLPDVVGRLSIWRKWGYVEGEVVLDEGDLPCDGGPGVLYGGPIFLGWLQFVDGESRLVLDDRETELTCEVLALVSHLFAPVW